jgi:DNA-binding NtrC family response regulator
MKSQIRRILVVENASEISPLISKMLDSETVKVDVTDDGDMAEKMLEQKEYVLCIIDLGAFMAKDEQLRQYMTEKYPTLLNGAIFTAGGIVAEDARVFMAQTKRQYLHKPFAPEWLKEMVSNAIKKIYK